MKRVAISIISLALGLVLIGSMHAPIFGGSASSRLRHRRVASGTIGRAFALVAQPRTVDSAGDLSLALQRLSEHGAGTYIDEVLAERDSVVIRWPDRQGRPLTVWVQPRSEVRDFTADYAARVREAFAEWNAVLLPVAFSFVDDSAAADVHVSWIDHFDEQISGRTHWANDDDWTISEANIVLAVHHTQGDLLEGDAMQAMALHEIGHLLGLDHTTDTLAVMAPRVRVRELSDADRATARLLYALPPGPLR